jgi:diguanylate cyclase (GGDEF)-like protein
VRKSTLIEGAFEAEIFFPNCGTQGKWFFMTAAPLTYRSGAIVGVIETAQDITEQKLEEKKLKLSEQTYKEQSITDSLTELYNARHFFRQLDYEVGRAKRYGSKLSLMLMDIDDFKKYNDSYGHPEGDKVLRTLSRVLKKGLRDSDTSCRYGGEEFTVLLPETTGKNALMVAERLRSSFEKEVLAPLPESEVHMTISIGISEYIPAEESKSFLRRADEAMYDAKNNGKNQSVFRDSTISDNE